MTAPLGRAVIGGLVVSTFATLLIVPSMFVLVMGDAKKVSPSIDPDDPSSRHYDFDGREPEAAHGGPRPEERPTFFLAEIITDAESILDRTKTRSDAANVRGGLAAAASSDCWRLPC